MEHDGDPTPSVRVEDGRIVEMDGRTREQFDFLDTFIADRAIDPAVAEEAMAIPPVEIAHMLVDPKVPGPRSSASRRGSPRRRCSRSSRR